MKRRTVGAGIIILTALIAGAVALSRAEEALATLVVSEGHVTLLQNTNAAPLDLAAGDIHTVNQGDHIALAAGATARLHFKDGSTVELYDGAAIAVSELDLSSTAFRVQLDLNAGRIVNRVVKLLGLSDSYKVRTPSSTAAVRGTVFSVNVLSGDRTFYAVESGVVEVAMAGQTLLLYAGESVTAVTNQPLQPAPSSGSDGPPAPSGSTATRLAPADALSSPAPATETVLTPVPTAVPSLLPASSLPPTPTALPAGASATPASTRPLQATPTATTRATDPQPAPPTALPPGPVTHTPPAATPIATSIPDLATPTPVTDMAPPTLPPATATPALATATNTPPPATATPAPATAIPATAVPSTETPPALVILCHIPAGNPDNPQTIQVLPEDVQAHLDHGDYLGPCQ